MLNSVKYLKPFNCVPKQMYSGSFKNVIYKMCLEIIYLIYMYKEDLALNNRQWLICHKSKPNNYILVFILWVIISDGIYNSSLFSLNEHIQTNRIWIVDEDLTTGQLSLILSQIVLFNEQHLTAGLLNCYSVQLLNAPLNIWNPKFQIKDYLSLVDRLEPKYF